MKLHGKIRRALSFGREEWHVRGSQLAFTGANWVAWRAGRALFARNGHLRSLGVSPAELPDWWRARSGRWFVDETTRERVRGYFRGDPEARQAVLERADHVVHGRMPLFSHRPVDFRLPDRWRRDLVLQVSSPNTFYASIDYLDVAKVGDSKNVWEPNRFGWAYWLGQAYAVTGDERYATCFKELTLDWVRRNRYPVGVNFCSALEMALRAYALVWAAHLFARHVEQDDELLSAILNVIWVSCRHIENNLSRYFAPNTHLMGEAFGLLACGAAFPEFREAARWRDLGQAILVAEASRQVHADGMHKELTSCYQLYATDFYVQASWIARRLDLELDSTIERTALRLARRVHDLALPNLHLPQFNDCDGGRLTGFCLDPLDAAPTLAAAHGLDAQFMAGPPARTGPGYSLWMDAKRTVGDELARDGGAGRVTPRMRSENLARPAQPQRESQPHAAQRTSLTAHDSGLVTCRNASGDYLLFRSGPFGYREGDYSHSHDAPTSFILYLAGVPLVVDSGTGAYTQSAETRSEFRAARGKNVLLIDGKGPSSPAGWFSWDRVTDAELECASWTSGGGRFRGRYATKGDDGSPVHVSREITLFDEGVVAVSTSWRATKPVSCTLSLTLHPDIQVSTQPQTLHVGSGRVFHVHAFVTDGLAVAGGLDVGRDRPATAAELTHTGKYSTLAAAAVEVPFSPSYGRIGKTRALTFDLDRRDSGSLVTLFSRAGALSVSPVQDELASNNDSTTFNVNLIHAGVA